MSEVEPTPLPDGFLTGFAATHPDFRPHMMWFWNAPLEEAGNSPEFWEF